jgi:hypothetical protein
MVDIVRNPYSQWDENYIICPYCGEQYGDCVEWVREYPSEMTCEVCDGVFTYESDIRVTYIARPVRPPPEDDEEIVEVVLGGTAARE